MLELPNNEPFVGRPWLYFNAVVGHNADVMVRVTVWRMLPLAALLLGGCATTGTVESRKQERYNAYAELTPEHKSTVDLGQIKVGMNMDAVYIAWGKPSQILAGESSQGSTLTWLYYGTYYEWHHYWSYHSYCYGPYGYYGAPYFGYDYYPRSYIRAEVHFQQGLVREWRSLPAPRY